jgi:uncharacterized protein (DUF697 family)
MTSEAKSKSQAAVTEEPVAEAATPTVEAAAPAGETVEPVSTPEDLSVRADTVIRHNVYWSLGAAVIPIQFLDTLALITVQLKMLKELGDLYGVPFKANAGKSAVTALLAGIGTSALSSGIVTSGVVMGLLRRAPVIGAAVSLVTMPSFSAAFTYAVGEVFKRHFASGGTFLSFDAKAVKAQFFRTFAEAKDKGLTAVAA